MSGVALSAHIQDALAEPDWERSIVGVKTAVANAIASMDRSVRVKDTGYFNHSFVPDFTVEWPSESAGRDIFLRVDSSAEFIADDIEYLGDTRPILMGLQAQRAENSESVRDVAIAAETMVTDPLAIGDLAESDTEFGRVVPAALLRGGRGVIEASEAAELTANSSAFFLGARSHDADVVAKTASSITKFVTPAQASRVVNFGRIVWEATGGLASTFPLETSLAGVDDEGLRFLLESGPAGDPAFWRSVGYSVTLERLIDLGSSATTAPNLRSFVAANLDQLAARFMMVKAGQESLHGPGLVWRVVPRALVLDGATFSAFFASKREDVGMSADKASPPTIVEFKSRVGMHKVDSIKLAAKGAKTITIESPDDFHADDDVLDALANQVDKGVERVGLAVAGKTLVCRFDERTASGNTNATFTIAELLEHALAVLWPLGDADNEAIAAERSVMASGVPQGSLFEGFAD